MILGFLSKIVSFFQNYREDDIELKRTSLNIQRNNLFHQDVPDLATVKQMTGNKFEEFQQIFNKFDPVGGESLLKYPSKYASITRIVIYKLPQQKTIKDIETLLLVEFSIIYKFNLNEFERKNEIVEEVFNFNKDLNFSNENA